MKKMIFLLLVPLCFLGLIQKAKANSEDNYVLRMDSTSCEIPLGGDVMDYLPEAYVFDPETGEEVTREGLIYYYDYQGIKLENVDTNSVGDYFIYMTVYHSEYFCPSIMNKIDIHVYDDIPPVANISSNISISYQTNFNVSNYVSYSDNSNTTCNIVLIGTYKNKPGTYNLSVEVTDRSNNSVRKDFTLTVFDNIAPVIYCDDVIEIDFDKDLDLNNYIKAVDECEGVLTYEASSFDRTTLGNKNVTIKAMDSSFNQATKDVVFKVVDKTSPKIELKNTELNEIEDYNLYDNILGLTDNYDTLDINNIKIEKKKVGTKRYLIKYYISDNSGNAGYSECFINYEYKNSPVIEGINLDDLKDVFDPLYYVNCYDAEDGNLNDKVMVVEMNYEEKYCIYEVYDSDDNLTRTRIDFINFSDLEKYENKSLITFPNEEEYYQESDATSNTVKNTNSYKSNNYNFLYYIVLGVFVLGVVIFILVKHFRKKMV